uniref:PB1 domain-containing protein n=1 Tax=Ananas comosus var. bracteatus TaxID=296719 RepID=A0A6V7NRH6_ANACO|nr:unnamed protein product [Ananas comosus var. bracteatus]
MENHGYAPFADPGGDSPRYRETENDSLDEPPQQQPSPRIKLMISYGGRIQPRPHDHQLSYVNGETKILHVDRSARFPALRAKLASIAGADELCVKYQLPGEDLDALVSVTNDEDLDHMILDPSPIASGSSTPSTPSRPAPAIPTPTPLDAAAAAAAKAPPSPDYLFGLDKGFVPPPAVKVKDPAQENPVVLENLAVEPPARFDQGIREDRDRDRQIGGEPSPVVSPAEIQRQIQELQKLQVHQQQQQQQQQQYGQQATAQIEEREALARAAYPGPEYYVHKVQEKAAATPTASPATAAAYWPVPRSVAAGRYASVAGGDQPVFLIPGVYPQQQGGYFTAVPGLLPADLYREGGAVYAAPAPPPQAAAKLVGQLPEGAGIVRGPAQAADPPAAAYAAQLTFDGTGRAVYYTGAVPSFQTTVASMTLSTEATKTVKPPQVS